MLKKIKEICLSLGVFSLLAVPMLVPAVAFADVTSDTITNNLCDGTNADTNNTSGGCTTGGGGVGLEDIMAKIINIFSVIVGFIAVVMIIFGGVKYITSGGDSGNISGAKNTIIYAIIGLIIVALAQIIVHYVINNIGKASTV